MRSRRVALVVLAAAVALGAGGPLARASGPSPEPEPAPAPADTSLHKFLGTLSDSTDRYFGMSAAPLDTAGLGSGQSYSSEGGRRIKPGLLPSFDFSRADGSTFGGGLRLQGPLSYGRLDLQAAYALSSKRGLGGARYHRRVRRAGVSWTLEGWGGREAAPLNRDHFEPFLDPSRALTTGSDRTSYVRHDGWRASFDRESDGWRFGLAVRDLLESPLPTRTAWNLFNRRLLVGPNLPAAQGRAREIQLTAGARLPVVPIRVEGDYWTSGPGLGSDFAYDRVRLAAGGDLPVGRWASLVPQAAWGFVNGDATPQQAFYLGAGPTLVSVPRDAFGGSSFGLAKLEVVAVRDLLGLLHIRRPELLYFQPAIFAATGAVSGVDPFGGPARPRERWPDRSRWLGESGVALHYSPGLLGLTIRMSEAWPIGPTKRGERFEFLISHPLDLLRKPLED
jgi:hypothetical protein